MSVYVMNHIWKHSAEKGSRLLLLLAIADNANDQGEAWPSVGTLAAKTRMSERQVQRMIQALVKDGALSFLPGNGRGHTHRFYIPVPESDKPRQDVALSSAQTAEPKPRQDVAVYQTERVTSQPERVTPGGKRVTSKAGKGDIAVSPEPSVEPSREPSERSVGADAPATPPGDEFTVLTYLQYLASTPAYDHIDPKVEASKIEIWHQRPANAKRKVTKLFIQNWVGRIERPASDAVASAKPPPGPKPFVCPRCRGEGEVVRMNPQTREDERIPCSCLTRLTTSTGALQRPAMTR